MDGDVPGAGGPPEPEPGPDPGSPTGGGTTGLAHIRLLARQSTLLISSGLFSYIGAFALNVLLARGLGAEGFGAWVIALAFSQTVATLGLLGADWIVLRQGSYYQATGDVARFRRTMHLALTMSLGALVVLGALLAILASTVAHRVLHDDGLAPLIRLAALLGPIMGLGQVMVYGTQAFRRMRARALIRNVLQPAFRLALTAAALLVHRSQLSAFVGLIAAEILLTFVATYALNRQLPLLGPTAPVDRRALVKFALPSWGTKVMETGRAQLFPVLLGSLAALSASGVFVASRRVAAAPGAVIATMNEVYAPIGSNLFLQGRMEEFAGVFKSVAKWSFMLGFPLFCLQVAFPKEILSLFGHDFRSASLALILLAVGMLFNFGTGPVTVTLLQAGRARLALLDYVGVLAVEVTLGIWLIPSHGVVGAALARMVGTGLNNLVPLLQVKRLLGLQPYRLDYWKPVVAGLAALVVAKVVVAVAGLGAGIPAAATAAAVIGVAYVALVLLFGLSSEDRAGVDAVLQRVRRGPGETQLGGPAPTD
jgi:O-antigen/teichoic acid export membrane protein